MTWLNGFTLTNLTIGGREIDMKDKIDTQGMSIPGKSKKPSSYAPMPVKHRTIFTPEERIELKQIINEALDERESKK